MADSPWPTIHTERKALVADLEGLSEDQWNTPSDCAGWSVKQLLGHMIATAKMTPPRFIGKMIGAGMNFDKMTAKGADAESAGTGAQSLATFRSLLDATTHPPGPVDTMLGEIIIHSQDIRRPLGISHDYPADAVVRVADFYKGSNLIVGAKKRIAGTTLKATDASWSTGSGPEASGPILTLVLAMTGRPQALEGLSGPGVDTLRAQM